MTTAPIRRPALRYFGSKFRLATWITDHLPKHVCYAEPFGGSAAVLIRKPPSIVEVFNDVDARIPTFFRVLRDRTDELLRAIELTPYARAEFQQSIEDADPADELEVARRLYVHLWQCVGGHSHNSTNGWRFVTTNANRSRTAVQDWNNLDQLLGIAARFKLVQIECDDWRKIVDRYDKPTTCFYADPPYPPSTRSARWNSQGYAHELVEADHIVLAERLHAIRGMAMISSYPSTLYDSLYADWTQVRTVGRNNFNRPTTECLWLNSAAASNRQLRLEEVT